MLYPLSPQVSGQSSQPATLVWSPDIRLTSTTNNSYSPKLAAFDGVSHVVWSAKTSNSTYQIFYKSSADHGTTWSANTQISSTPYESTHPSVAVVGSNVYIIWSDYLQGPTYWQKGIMFISSGDGGVTWNSPSTLELSIGGAYEPALAADGNSVYVSWTDVRDGASRIYFKASANNGVSWGSDLAISTLGVAATKSSITASAGTVNIVWTAADQTTGYPAVWSARSTNSGQSFSSPVELSTSPVETATPNIDSSGQSVFLAWSDQRNGPGWEIYGKASSDGGATWTSDIRLSNGPANSMEPSVAITGSSVYVVWRDHRDGNANIYFTSSSDLGASWGPETRLTFDSSAHYEPQVAVDSQDLYVVWEDNRNGNWQIYSKISTGQSVNCSPTTLLVGQSIGYSGSGMTPNGQVNISIVITGFSQTIQSSTTANASGAISGNLPIGHNVPPNSHSVVFTDVATSRTASCSILAYAGWDGLGGWIQSSPTVVTTSSRVDVFVRGGGSVVYHRAYANGVWSGWDTTGGLTSDNPSAALCDGQIHLVVRGTDNGIYDRAMDPSTGQWLTGWTYLNGMTASEPAIAASPRGCELVVRGTDNGIYHKYSSGGVWSSQWTWLQGTTSDVPATAVFSGMLYVVVRGTETASYGGVWVKTYTFASPGGWSNWSSIPGATNAAPALVASSNRLDLVVRGTDNGFYHSFTTGTSWSSWFNLGGASPSPPSLSTLGSRVYLFVRGSDNRIYYRALDLGTGGWLINWVEVGGMTDAAIALSNSSARLDVVVMGTDSSTYDYYLTS